MGCCESRDKTDQQNGAAPVDIHTEKMPDQPIKQQDQDHVATQNEQNFEEENQENEANEEGHEEGQEEEGQEEEVDAEELKIDVQDVKFDDADQVNEHLEKFRGHMHKTITIDLSGNSFGLGAAQKVAEFLWEAENVTNVNLNNIFVGRLRDELPQSLGELMTPLAERPIIVLNLSDNAFGPDGLNAFNDFLKNSTTLKSLYLNNCGLGPEGAEILSDALIERGENHLTHLDIGRNRMQTDGAIHMCKYLDTIECLEFLNIAHNSIEDEGMKNLLSVLEKNANSLRYLEINDNQILYDSIDNLVSFLQQVTVLETLDISDSNINKRRRQRKVIDAINQDNVKNTLVSFKWNYDIEFVQMANQLFETLLEFPDNLQEVSAVGLIKKKFNRLALRAKFEQRNTKIILSEKDNEPEPGSDSSDDQSEDEENSEDSSD